MSNKIPLDFVMRKLKFKSQAKFAAALGVHKTSPSDWRKRIGGSIPSRHWRKIVEMGLSRGVLFVIEDFYV